MDKLEIIQDCIELSSDFAIEEAKSEVDGQHILGKLKGQFFVPNGVSRNKRFYSKNLWEKVLSDEDVKSKLKDRRMFGTISHNQKIDDDALRDGKISHIVTNLTIDGDKGMGEALILNTPTGQILNTMLRAGSKLYVSSRALGKFDGHFNGVPAVDESNYQFSGFDSVIDPGFHQAQPELVESLETNNIEGEDMDRELIEKVVLENATLKADLSRALNESKKLNEESEEVESENDKLKAKIAELEAKIKELEGKNASSTDMSDRYKQLGSPKEIQDALETCESIIKTYKAIGTPEDISKALTESKALLDEYRVLGTPKQLDEAIDKSVELIKQYKEVGTPEEISEAINRSYKAITEYQEFGTVSELKEAFDKMTKVVTTMKNESVDKKIKELSTELHVTEESIKKLYGKVSEQEIREVFKKVNESVTLNKKFTAPAKINEDKEETVSRNPMNESRINRIMQAFN